MSDVTTEEIEREMPAAWEAVKNGLAGQTLAATFARALATVRKEARREALGEAAKVVDDSAAFAERIHEDKRVTLTLRAQAFAIRALMEKS